MSDFAIEPQNTLITGMTGSGKTTLVIKGLLNSNVACNFIFDDENRTAPRLRLKPCYTERELEDALATRWVIFNPSRMFLPRQGDRDMLAPKKRAFAYFCAWVFQSCGRGPGKKIISLPEIWRFCSEESIPPEFATLMQMGRELNTHVVLDTQRPEKVNGSITGASTELICFRLLPAANGDCPLRSVERLGADRKIVENLPRGSFIAYNRLEPADNPQRILRGRMF